MKNRKTTFNERVLIDFKIKNEYDVDRDCFWSDQEVLEMMDAVNKNCNLQNVIRRHFVDDGSCVAFINALDELLSRMDFDSERKIKSAESTTASIVLKLKKFKTLPENEGYYLGINKISRAVLD